MDADDLRATERRLARDVTEMEDMLSDAFESVGPIAAAARASAAKTAANPVLAGGTAGLTGGKARSGNDGGLGVVRIKPLGAGGGGGERSAASSRAVYTAPSGEMAVPRSPVVLASLYRLFSFAASSANGQIGPQPSSRWRSSWHSTQSVQQQARQQSSASSPHW